MAVSSTVLLPAVRRVAFLYSVPYPWLYFTSVSHQPLFLYRFATPCHYSAFVAYSIFKDSRFLMMSIYCTLAIGYPIVKTYVSTVNLDGNPRWSMGVTFVNFLCKSSLPSGWEWEVHGHLSALVPMESSTCRCGGYNFYRITLRG